MDNHNGRIKLPKIGWMRYRKSREIAGTPKNVTVSLVHGKAFISIQTEREVATPMHPSKSSVGLDWGIKRFYTLSNGKYREQLSPLQQFAVKVAKLQRVLNRKKKFSNNWKKAKFKVAKLHNKIANIRKDFVHKSSNDLSKNHAVVFIEDLSIRNMSKSARGSQEKHGKNVKRKSGLNRAVLDASPFELRRQLQYKLRWRGGLLVAVPPQNTSRRCPAVRYGFCGESQDAGEVLVPDWGRGDMMGQEDCNDDRANRDQPGDYDGKTRYSGDANHGGADPAQAR